MNFDQNVKQQSDPLQLVDNQHANQRISNASSTCVFEQDDGINRTSLRHKSFMNVRPPVLQQPIPDVELRKRKKSQEEGEINVAGLNKRDSVNHANNFIGFNKKTMSEYRDEENASSKYSDREIDDVGEDSNDISKDELPEFAHLAH